MRKSFMIVPCMIIFATAVPCFSDSSLTSQRVKLMQDRLARREVIVSEWGSQAHQQMYLSITVGLLGLIVGLLQGTTKNSTRWLTVGLGFCVSAITLYTNKVYTADYRTLLRSVDQAAPIIEDLKDMLAQFDPGQSSENQVAFESDFKTKCGKIDLIGQKILGIDPQPQDSSNEHSRLGTIGIVYAQSKSAAPAWASTKVQSDKASTYFVGSAENSSLTAAKAASLDNAVRNGARWLKDGQIADSQAAPAPQLVELVKHAADVADTWFTYDRGTRVYRYYTRLRLTNEFRSRDPDLTTLETLSTQGFILGLSLSQYSKKTDLSALKQRLQFAYVRVSQGSNRKDVSAQQNIDAALTAGFKVGLYHVFAPQDDREKQAENFLGELKLRRWNLPPTIDCEQFPGANISGDYADRLYEFAYKIQQKTGIKPVIYTTQSFAEQHLDQRFSDFPLWVAKYLSGSNTEKPKLPRWWSDFTFWHFTTSINDPALRNLDIVAFNGDSAKLDHLLDHMKVSP